DGGGTGGADVIDNDDFGALLAEAFDTLTSTVLLLGFADEEAVELAAGDGYSNDDRVGSHGESTDGWGLPAALANLVEDNVAGELGAAGVEGGGAAIDVVVAGCARGEREVSQLERFMGQQAKQFLADRWCRVSRHGVSRR